MALEDTRQKILRAALEMVREDKSAVPLTVRLQDAAARAGYTTGSAYKLWKGGQDEFRRDLFVFFLRVISWETRPDLSAVQELLEDQEVPLSEYLRVLSRADFDSFMRDADAPLHYLFLAAACRNPEMHSAIKFSLARRSLELDLVYSRLLLRFNRELKGQYTFLDLTKTIQAVMDGFIISSLVWTGGQPDVVTRRQGGRKAKDWYLVACAIEAVLESFTEPVSTRSKKS